ncbi:retrovirus-related Pol polyprotein from transposon 17.6 [Trichonephila clavipes]|nr:retrovirus-related Pol polyprotein from transposon 17.6 [Trichonephila clavipes]
MIHPVIREDPRSWDRQLPFLLFAYREVPNTTTGVSPFRLLYGREARWPLAILKSSWAGEIHLPTNISQSAADYLQEMKVNMEKAAESASLTAAQKQKAYGDYFNKRSSVKNFSIGEQVVLLIPDSIKLSDGTVRHVHVNKIRKYHPRALAVGVIFEDDHEFGEIHPTPNLSKSTSERVLHEINLNHLKKSEREQVLAIVLKHQTLFTSDVKIAKVGTHRIRLKPNIEQSLKIKVDEQIEELLRLDLIEESDAEIAYPIVCVNKKDGTLRLCVDFRALNSESVSDDFPMEDAVELIHSIGRANIIRTLDLLKGYWAIPMAEDSKNLTSFKTHRQQYHFKVMSFGLKNASATFQREMNKALSCYRKFSRAYIDDIAIFSKNWEEHLHLDTILTKLSELNFTVNLKKCAFGKAQIKYLGHIIGSGKHEPDPEKTAVINNLPVPKTKKELRSVLGLCNYYLEAPSLYSPVPDKPYTIHSDASQIGIAACLSQKCGDKCYPIAYASQKLSKTQQSWSTIEREAFAIVWSLKKFEVWVFGTEIEFYTDHNPLPYLTKSAPQSARLQRWAFALQKFNVTIKHCPDCSDWLRTNENKIYGERQRASASAQNGWRKRDGSRHERKPKKGRGGATRGGKANQDVTWAEPNTNLRGWEHPLSAKRLASANQNVVSRAIVPSADRLRLFPFQQNCSAQFNFLF